jgi:hypothetical protein
VVGDSALHRLPDPPRGIGRELEPAAPVELLDGTVEAERALLNEVQERDAQAAVALGDGHDEPQVGFDHAPLGGHVTALDRLRERDLLGGRQQLVAADVGEEELQAVGGAWQDVRRVGSRALDRGRGFLGRRRLHGRDYGLSDLQPDRLELARQLLDVVLGQFVLERKRLELRGLHEPALLCGHDHRPAGFAFKQLVQLMLGQVLFNVLSNRRVVWVPLYDLLRRS